MTDEQRYTALLTSLAVSRPEGEEEPPSPYTAAWGEVFEVEGQEWLVLTDDEADEAFRASVENYVDECLEMPDNVRPYFDTDAFIRDVELNDGRGPTLSAWDGAEEEVKTPAGVWLYLYRQN